MTMSLTDEGYIKFQAVWQQTEPVADDTALQALIEARQLLYGAGLIGQLPDGIGYGNISQRLRPGSHEFIISGSATGGIAQLTTAHFALVTAVDIAGNQLYCAGPVIASSESMSHAAVYLRCPEAMAVIHVHHYPMWASLLDNYPTTAPEATYGSPQMAFSIINLFDTTDLLSRKLLVMRDHPEGIIAFGELAETSKRLVELAAQVRGSKPA
jgi:ribulose-5-phosphate 4-epimerase/fuculose-1-phosphate aldolase